jgi:hypothetical protein
MSTIIDTKDSGAIHATSRSDVSIYIVTPNPLGGLQPVGIAKTFNFNVNKPKTAIEVISQLVPAGYARNPEDRTFTMDSVNVFERLEWMSYFQNSATPFIIRIVYCNSTDDKGVPLPGAKFKITQLEGVEFENMTSNIDANGTEFTVNFTGKFRSGLMTGDIDAPVDPITYMPDPQTSLPL